MLTRLKQIWGTVRGRAGRAVPGAALVPADAAGVADSTFDIAPDEALIAYFQRSPGAVAVEAIPVDSPALRALRAAGVKLVVPLVSHGELVGLLSLGARRSEQDYSTDDRSLLTNLAAQAAPALRVAQLVQQHQTEVLARERLEQELRLARQIQLSLLPRAMPSVAGWQFATYYQPARAVGGDFYDFLPLPDGRLVVIVGDVSDKGVPAALLMATTRGILRGTARRLAVPGLTLERTNEALCHDMPPSMFVTCFVAIIDPASGLVRFANAGHDPPHARGRDGVVELLARGMPLGLLPNMRYEERSATLRPGDTLVFFSDGLVEAHGPAGEMFGSSRLIAALSALPDEAPVADGLIDALERFVGPDWEQEDDVTLVVVRREAVAPEGDARPTDAAGGEVWRLLTEFPVANAPGNERAAVAGVLQALEPVGLATPVRERIETAVAEATMNAMEHGNGYDSEVPTRVRVLLGDAQVAVEVIDQGGGRPEGPAEEPDLEAKLVGLQSPRGWGLFLIQQMVDDLRVRRDGRLHTMELRFARAGLAAPSPEISPAGPTAGSESDET